MIAASALLLALAAEPSAARSLRAAAPELSIDDAGADSMVLGDLGGDTEAAADDDGSVADLEAEDGADDSDADDAKLDDDSLTKEDMKDLADDDAKDDMKDLADDDATAPMVVKTQKRSAKSATVTKARRAAKVKKAVAVRSLVHQQPHEVHLHLMNAINVMRAEFCLRRPDLMQHEKCLDFLMDRCAVESSGYGYCHEFESILRKRCTSGNEDVAHHKSGCELHNELCSARRDCEAIHSSGTQPPPQAAAPTEPATQPPTTAAPTLVPTTAAPTTAAPTTAAAQAHLDEPAQPAPTADDDGVAAGEEDLNGALETDYSQPDHFHEDTHGSPSPAAPFTGDKLIGAGQPDQGYNEHSTKHVAHANDLTMTSDWRGEWPQYDETEDTSVDNICQQQPELKWCRLWLHDRGMVTTTVAMPLMHEHAAKSATAHRASGHKAGHKTAHESEGKTAHDSEQGAGHEAAHEAAHEAEHAQGAEHEGEHKAEHHAEQGAEHEATHEAEHQTEHEAQSTEHKAEHNTEHEAEHTTARKEERKAEHKAEHKAGQETKHEAEGDAAKDDADDSVSISEAIDDIDNNLPGGMGASSDEMDKGAKAEAKEVREVAHVDDVQESMSDAADATEESMDEAGHHLPPGMLGTGDDDDDDKSESKSEAAGGESGDWQQDFVHDNDIGDDGRYIDES